MQYDASQSTWDSENEPPLATMFGKRVCMPHAHVVAEQMIYVTILYLFLLLLFYKYLFLLFLYFT